MLEVLSMNWTIIIKAIRNKLFITQTELANMIGVSFASVNRWEQGHHEPTMKAKRKLAEICRQNGIDMEAF